MSHPAGKLGKEIQKVCCSANDIVYQFCLRGVIQEEILQFSTSDPRNYTEHTVAITGSAGQTGDFKVIEGIRNTGLDTTLVKETKKRTVLCHFLASETFTKEEL